MLNKLWSGGLGMSRSRLKDAGRPTKDLTPFFSFADAIGRDNVIAGTDCGLGGRVHPQIAWAKLRVLCEGAALASKKLWN